MTGAVATPATNRAEGGIGGWGVAPLRLMLLGALLALALVAVSAWLCTRQPWLGVTLEPSGVGLVVTAIAPDSPLASRAAPGQVWEEVRVDGDWYALNGFAPGREPHTFSDYAGYNGYFANQRRLWSALQRAPLEVRTAAGETLSVAPAAHTPLAALPASFWLFHLFGLLALLPSLGVWSFRTRRAASRLLLASGIGFFGATWTNAWYLPRELAFDPALFRALSQANHLALYLMLGALLALLVYFPRRLTRAPAVAMITGTLLLLLANEVLQIIEWPGHTFYVPIVGMYVGGVALALWQWRLARRQPLDRAALKWVFISIFISTGLALVAYFVPAFFGHTGRISQVAMVGLASTLYIGLALGVLRYRLFDLERWWFEAWLWFFGGLAVVILDAALVYLFGLRPVAALGIALMGVGWLYLPVRQWLWNRVTAMPEVPLERYLPQVVDGLMRSHGYDDDRRHWQALLREVFNPLTLEAAETALGEVSVAENGATLLVPDPAGGRGWRLGYAAHGARLFHRRDVRLIEALYAVVRQFVHSRDARESGAREERARIMRDLHDDVGANLLSLVIGAQEASERRLARFTLKALRESIYALDQGNASDLQQVLEDARDEVEERVAAAGAVLHWDHGRIEAVQLSARQRINVQRILQEAVSNALKHAAPTRVEVLAACQAQALVLSVSNNNASEKAGEPGKGLHNMRTRAAELGGQLWAGPEGGHYKVRLQVPLDEAMARTGSEG